MNKDFFLSLLPLVVIVLIFYFLIIRPNRNQQKRHKEMVDGLSRGDKIVTNGGFICEVVKQEDGYITVDMGNNRVKLLKEYVAYKMGDDKK